MPALCRPGRGGQLAGGPAARFPAQARYGDDIAVHMRDAYHAPALDRRGRGKSDRAAEYSRSTMLTDLAALLAGEPRRVLNPAVLDHRCVPWEWPCLALGRVARRPGCHATAPSGVRFGGSDSYRGRDSQHSGVTDN